jgi:hypoxanthine phosphoribosyltransferase
MPDLVPVLTKDEIDIKISSIARRISQDYLDRKPVLVAVLKGAFVFLSDLIRKLTIPVQIDFIRACSYGSGTSSSGYIELTKGLEIDVKDKDLLIIEDIVDTGLTLDRLFDYLNSFDPKSVRVCTLIDKLERRKSNIQIDYACHVVEAGFLVGYGLDYAEDYRNLPEIYHLKL